MTKIEKIIAFVIVFWVLLFVGSCSTFFWAVDKCGGLKGIVETVWEGTDCEAH